MDEKRPFTRADAVAAGISPRRLGGSRFRRIFTGVFISSSVREHPRHRIEGALLLFPEGAWVSHTSAAYLYGVVVPPSPRVHISVVDPKDRRWQPGIKPHVAPRHTKVTRRAGLPVSDPIRMFIELASMLDLVDLVVAGDNMLRVLGLSASDLVSALDKTRDYWSPAARHAAQFVRDGVDSPMETRLRMLIVLAGLPEPTVNHTIRDHEGNIVARFDLSFPRLKLIVEFDGRIHAEDIRTWEKDLERREFLDDIEWRVLKVTAKGIYVEPGRTLDRVWRALCQRGPRVPLPGDGWRAHFPERSRVA